MKALNFDRVVAVSTTGIKVDLTKYERKQFKLEDDSINAIIDLNLDLLEQQDLIEANVRRCSATGAFVREHIAHLKALRQHDLDQAQAEGIQASRVPISDGLRAYIEHFWVIGYTSRAIEAAFDVSDSTISRYTRELRTVNRGKKHGQIVELLKSWEEFNITEYQRCPGTETSYTGTSSNAPYTENEIYTIKTMAYQGYSAQEIANVIDRKSLNNIIKHMKKAFTNKEYAALKCIHYSETAAYGGGWGARDLLQKRGMEWVLAYYTRHLECLAARQTQLEGLEPLF